MLKNSLKVAIALIAFVLAMGLNSCSKVSEGTTPVDNGSGYDMIYSYFSVSDLTFSSSETELEQNQGFPEFGDPNGGRNGNDDKGGPGNDDKGGRGKGHGGNGIFMGKILRDLKLTPEQLTQIKTIMTDGRPCFETAMKAAAEARKVIMDKYAAQRQQIMDDLKNGVIDRTKAKELMMALSEAIRTEIQNDPAVQAAELARCECLKKMLTDIRSVLTPEQWVTWDAWVATLKGPCFTTTP